MGTARKRAMTTMVVEAKEATTPKAVTPSPLNESTLEMLQNPLPEGAWISSSADSFYMAESNDDVVSITSDDYHLRQEEVAMAASAAADSDYPSENAYQFDSEAPISHARTSFWPHVYSTRVEYAI